MEHSLSVVDFVLVVEVAERDIGLHPHILAGNYLLAVVVVVLEVDVAKGNIQLHRYSLP